MKQYLAIIWLLINLLVLSQLSLALEPSTNEFILLTLKNGILAKGNPNDLKGDMTHENQKGMKEKKEFSIIAAKLIKLSGYTQVRYRIREDNIDGFDIKRARLSFKGKISKQFSYKLQTELGGSSQKLLDTELTFDLHPILKLCAGQFKIPFSQENLMSSSGLATINRSQVVEALTARSKDVLGNQSGRDIGIKLSGSFSKITDWSLFDYALGVYNGSGINTSDLNEQKDVVGRLVIHPVKNIALGGSYYRGKYTIANALSKIDNRKRVGAEFTCTYSLISFMAEYIKGKDSSIEKAGWYVQAGCFFIPRKIQGILKYDTYDPNTDVSDNSTTVYTIGVNLFLDKKSKIQINYELKINEQGTEKEYNPLIAQLQFAF